MKDGMTAFDRRIEMLFFLLKHRKTTVIELANVFSVCRKTAYNDLIFLSRYAPIYTKRGMFGGIFLNDESRKNLLLYLSDDEERILKKLSVNLDNAAKYHINNILNKYSKPKNGT